MGWLPHITVSLVTVYAGFYLGIVFLSLSIACGLYYIAELIEENTITTKRLLGYAIKAELALHLLLLVDRPPVLCVAGGIAAHLAYLRLLRRFPYISLTSPAGLASSGCFLCSLGLWARHYWHTYYTIEYVAAFLLVTTLLLPFILFLSMAGEQAVLPGAGGFPYTAAGAGTFGRGASSGTINLAAGAGGSGAAGVGGSSGGGGVRARRSLALRLFDVLRRKRDEVLPDVLASAGSFRKEKV